MQKTALITGVTGMDGSHLADFLVEKGYKVFGMKRRTSFVNDANIAHLKNKISFVMGDLGDQNSLLRCLEQSSPDEVYNLASQSFVQESWNTPEQSADITGVGVLRMLEAIRMYNKPLKFYQASTSEMFGKMEGVANESTKFHPRSPYGVAKLYGHWITTNYKESYNMFNVSGILFNHESERRGIEFVTRKITHGIAKIFLGLQDHITLGNLDIQRDWGYAPDFVKAMWLMMQQKQPEDFVIATGQTHSLRHFLDVAFQVVGINNWAKYVTQDSKFMRPADVFYLKGDATRAAQKLQWTPNTSFEEMIKKMIQNDIVLLKERH